MIHISIDIESQFGLNWTQWKNIVARVEALGFAGLYRSDHFTVYPQPPDDDALELVTSLTYVADHTHRIHFGPLVAPLSFHNPVMLARQAAALDDLSGGRFVLGVGAGWSEREHRMFGFALQDGPTRYARFAEGLEIITRLLRTYAPTTFEGIFFQLDQATLLPRPSRTEGPPLLIPSSGSKRSLSLVARYADILNMPWRTPEDFRRHSNALDGILKSVGRPAHAVKRTVMTMLLYGATRAQIERQTRGFRRFVPQLADLPFDEFLVTLRQDWNALVGTDDEIVSQIDAYAAAGVEELMLEWLDAENLEGLEEFAINVLPRVST